MSQQVIRKITRGLCLVTLGCIIGACTQKEEPVKQPAPPPAPADTTKRSVTIESGTNIVEIIDTQKPWPDDAPKEVPSYTKGTIRKIIRTETPDGNSWDMAIDDLPAHALRDYEAALKAKEFETTSFITEQAEGDRGSVTGIKGPITVVLIGSGKSMNLSIIEKQ